MESLLQQYSKEYMKMAILKHEETFKEQVNELHRLYRVQKLLMRDMKSKGELANHQKFTSPWWMLDLECSPEEYTNANDAGRIPEVHEKGDVELTLSLGSSWRKKQEVSVAFQQDPSVSSSSTESSSRDPSIQDWSTIQIKDINLNCPMDSSSSLGTEEQMTWNRKEQSSWHIQLLRSNTTW